MKLNYINKKWIAIFTHNFYFNGTDKCFLDLYEKEPARSNRIDNQMIIRPRKEIGRMSTRYRGPIVWNCLLD